MVNGDLFFYYDRHSVCLSSTGIFPQKNDIERNIAFLFGDVVVFIFPKNQNL